MQSKISVVSSWLSECFAQAPVSHQRVDMLHKFRVETAPMRWLYVSDDFLSGQPEGDLLIAIRSFNVFRQLTANPGPTHLLLTYAGIAEVDAAFGRSASD